MAIDHMQHARERVALPHPPPNVEGRTQPTSNFKHTRNVTIESLDLVDEARIETKPSQSPPEVLVFNPIKSLFWSIKTRPVS